MINLLIKFKNFKYKNNKFYISTLIRLNKNILIFNKIKILLSSTLRKIFILKKLWLITHKECILRVDSQS